MAATERVHAGSDLRIDPTQREIRGHAASRNVHIAGDPPKPGAVNSLDTRMPARDSFSQAYRVSSVQGSGASNWNSVVVGGAW